MGWENSRCTGMNTPWITPFCCPLPVTSRSAFLKHHDLSQTMRSGLCSSLSSFLNPNPFPLLHWMLSVSISGMFPLFSAFLFRGSLSLVLCFPKESPFPSIFQNMVEVRLPDFLLLSSLTSAQEKKQWVIVEEKNRKKRKLEEKQSTGQSSVISLTSRRSYSAPSH